MLAIAGLITFVIPNAIEGVVEGNIRDALVEDNIKEALDKAKIAAFAGEGLGEAMALWAIEESAALHHDDGGGASGRNRFRNQTWQQIVVTDGKASILIRTELD